MSTKRKSNVDDSGEKCGIIGDSDSVDPFGNDSEGSDIVSPVRKRPRKLIIEDDSDDEDSINQQSSKQWFWKEKHNKPNIWKYMQTPGIRAAILDQLGRSKRELDFFYIMFDNVFWDNIVQETNRYAEQTISYKHKRKGINESWIPVDCNEIKIYFALCIIMAQVRKPKIQMNWSKRAIIETPIFRKSMPLKRFLQITRFLHFANNDATDNRDKLRKVRPVINYFNKKFEEVYEMEENIVIDESLMKFKGRMSYRQFNPPKRVRFGIKFYRLCKSASGYCYNFKIYSGNDKTNHDYIDYNKRMIGIDRQDQVLAGFPIMRKFVKGYRKIFFYICDMALLNSYILYNENNMAKKQNYSEYRLRIAEGLLQTVFVIRNTCVPSQDYNSQGPLSNGNVPMRLQAQHWGHFPKHIDPTPLKKNPTRACKVCTKNKKRSETTWECKNCQVALHVPHCFERYHTVEDY